MQRILGVAVVPTVAISGEGIRELTSRLKEAKPVAIGVVLPAIFIFCLMLALLEDMGYMPRLAVFIDTVLHKIGLHGYAIVPTILSIGCNVPCVTATRIPETKKRMPSYMPCMHALRAPGIQQQARFWNSGS